MVYSSWKKKKHDNKSTQPLTNSSVTGVAQYHCLDIALLWNKVAHLPLYNFSKPSHLCLAILETVMIACNCETRREEAGTRTVLSSKSSHAHEPFSPCNWLQKFVTESYGNVSYHLKIFALCRRFSKGSRGRELVLRRRQQRRSVTGPADESRLSSERRPSAVPLWHAHPERGHVTLTGTSAEFNLNQSKRVEKGVTWHSSRQNKI